MMKKLIPTLLSTVFISGFSATAFAVDEMDSTLYIESTKAMNLYVSTTLKSGEQALTSHLTVPEETILAIDISALDMSLTANKLRPGSLRFPVVVPGENRVQNSNDGWVCGMRIVDINDDELRSSEIAERADLCLLLKDFETTTALETNGSEILESFTAYKAGNLAPLNSLSRFFEDERIAISNGMVYKTALTEKMISPLQKCTGSCLVVTSEYGSRRHPVFRRKMVHRGVDLRAKIGTPVVSVYAGKVLATRSERAKRKKKLKGYGHYVIVVHPQQKLETLYGHLSAFKVKAGSNVSQGQVIALSGNTGTGTAAHLHFETRILTKKGSAAVNPRKYLQPLMRAMASFMELFKFNV